jgi:hypothetical protein
MIPATSIAQTGIAIGKRKKKDTQWVGKVVGSQ